MTVFMGESHEFAALLPILRMLPEARLTDFNKEKVFDMESLAEALLAYIQRQQPDALTDVPALADRLVAEHPDKKIYCIKELRAATRLHIDECKLIIENAIDRSRLT